MKKFALVIILLLNSLTVSFATGPEIQNNQKQMAKEQLLNLYTELMLLNDEQWTKAFLNMAKIEEDDGNRDQAQMFMMYADPGLKTLILERMNDNIDELSNNGIILAFTGVVNSALVLSLVIGNPSVSTKFRASALK